MVYKKSKVFIDGKFEEREFVSGKEPHNECNRPVYIIPRLVDIHSHGCAGFDFSYATVEEIEKMAEYYYSNGIGTVLATTMTESRETMLKAAENVGRYMEEHRLKESVIAGLYMEGPFFGKEKKGAHDEKYLIPVDLELLNEYCRAGKEQVKIVAFDPCVDGAGELIERYKDRFVLTIAHTPCDYTKAMELMKNGINHVTHLYNAMDGLDKRKPGIPGAVLDTENCYAEIICDGIHIHPSVIRTMFKCHGDHMVLISDSMSATGLSDGRYTLGGQEVTVKSGKATLSDGTIAGSVNNLYEMFKKAVSFGVPLEQAVAATTINPAKSARLETQCGFVTEKSYLVLNEQLEIIE